MKLSRKRVIKLTEMSGLLYHAISWYLAEWRKTVEHTGEVKFYSKEEITQYLKDQQ